MSCDRLRGFWDALALGGAWDPLDLRAAWDVEVTGELCIYEAFENAVLWPDDSQLLWPDGSNLEWPS